MQLRKLQLVGFKSFADKTEIELGDGLTAVVGPNGCGKSNVADALLWVMGEQNPRLLRGSEGRDVIFSGTDRRKPVGMAEVRLTIDNSDHGLPIQFAEVTVARRLLRSGESQYLLNGAPCRLKDVVELFMDTGVGRGAYSFVSQSEIDAVLSARPEDRRELFEEAAGIKKYRTKKREAVRKLEVAEANLTRIRDIVHELDRQRAPLEKQAEEARRYLAISSRLQEIEVGLLVADAQKSDYELYAARRERELDIESIQNLDGELARLEREAGAVGERLAEAEHELDSARMSHQSALTVVERTQSKLQLAFERGQAAERSAESLDADLHALAQRSGELERRIVTGAASLEKLEAGEAEGRRELAALRARLAELEAALADARRRSEDGQGALRRLAEQRTQREAALAACRSRLADTESRIEALKAEAAALSGQRAEAEERAAACRSVLADLGAARAALEARAVTVDAAAREARDAQSRTSVALDAARRLLAERSSRLATLTELQESGEGFYQGVRAVLQAHRQGRLAGHYAPVVDLLTVPEAYRVAIEVALGGSLQDVVCDTEAEAKAAIAWLKSSRSGRATFLALPLLRPGPSLSAAAVRGLAGVLGVAADLASAETRYTDVLKLLLGRVVVASDMDAAISASRKLQGWGRIVTLEGEVLAPGGALTGGSLQGRSAHLVGRKGEIDDLKRAMPALHGEVQRLETEQAACVAAVGQLGTDRAAVGKEAADLQARMAAAERDVSASQREEARLASALRDTEAEAARLRSACGDLAGEIERWEAAVAESQAEDTDADDAIAAALEEAREIGARRDEARSQATACEVEAGRLAEKRAAQRRALAGDREALQQAAAEREQRLAQREETSGALAGSLTQQQDLEGALRTARENLATCETHLAQWQERRQVLLAESFGKASAIKERSASRSQVTQELHDAELRIARLEVRLSQIGQRLSDDYGMSLDEALARPEEDAPDREVTTEVARLRRELKQMGQVNTGAVDEYERLTERYDFLEGQRQDLDKARESLLATIAEIDESTRDTFMKTFEAVSSEFDRLFGRLFGGGTTRLVLTNPDDLLETGIEVIAQPAGKRPQHLSLLSGGERALTAVALLFSFLAVRPSPFVLLDEVDAPLDGANVERFVDLVKDFAAETQFLVITHNPSTMEAAPRWYGVTMQEPGVSRVLAYRVPEGLANANRNGNGAR